MLTSDNTVLVLVDVQAKLLPAMHEPDAVLDSLLRLVRGAQLLEIPIVCTEQIPEKLGPTVAPLRDLLPGVEMIAKTTFSCCGTPAFVAALEGIDRPNVLVAGIEAHVCVYQTVVDLVESGYFVQVVADAVSSRTVRNRDIALTRVHDEGAVLTSVEMALLEMTREAGTDLFREMLKVVR